MNGLAATQHRGGVGQELDADLCRPGVTIDVLEDSAMDLAVAWAAVRPRASPAQMGSPRSTQWCPEPAPAFGSDMRRRHWLAGRFVLNAGFRAVGLPPEVHASTVFGTTGRGSPRLVTAGGVPLYPPVQVSIAHSGVHVGCGFLRGGAPKLGFDVEEDLDAALRNLGKFASQDELDALRAACGESLPAHLWCVKEAIAKATGWGFTIAPKRYRVSPCPVGGDNLAVNISGSSPGWTGRLVARIAVGTRGDPSPAAWALARVWPSDQKN